MKRLLFSVLGFISLLVLLSTVILYLSKWAMEYSNSDSFISSLSSVSTSVAAVGGVSLLVVTYLTFLETRKQRISKELPAVSIRLVPDEIYNNFLNISLKNSGGGPAYDLQVTFSPDLPYGNDLSLNKLNMFKRMPLLDSGEEIVFFFDSLVDHIESNKPKIINAEVSYFSFPKEVRSAKKFLRIFELNFEERYGQRQLVKKDLHNLVNEIEEIKHAILIANYERGERDD